MINYTNAHSKKESKAVFWCSFQTTKPVLESKFFQIKIQQSNIYRNDGGKK